MCEACLEWSQDSGSLHLHARIRGLYRGIQWAQSYIPSWWSQKHISLLRLCSWKWFSLGEQCGLPRWLNSKESACSAGAEGGAGSIPGLRRPFGGGNGNTLWYSCLENPMDRGAWRVTVCGVAKSWTRLKRLRYKHREPVGSIYPKSRHVGEELLIALVLFLGQPVVMPSWWPPPADCWNPTQGAVFLMRVGDCSMVALPLRPAQYLYLNSKARTPDTLAFTSIHGLKPKWGFATLETRILVSPLNLEALHSTLLQQVPRSTPIS